MGGYLACMTAPSLAGPSAARPCSHAGRAAGARRPRRPEYKLHKKEARSKGTRGRADDAAAAYDGAAVAYGRRGGLVRALS
jgi:hypothetical protein